MGPPPEGRTARLLVTMDSPPWYDRWITGQPGIRGMLGLKTDFTGKRADSSRSTATFGQPARPPPSRPRVRGGSPP